MLMVIPALYVVFAKSTFQLWSQVLKIKLLHCLKFILSLKKKKIFFKEISTKTSETSLEITVSKGRQATCQKYIVIESMPSLIEPLGQNDIAEKNRTAGKHKKKTEDNEKRMKQRERK